MHGKKRNGWVSGAVVFFFGLFLWGLPQGGQAASVNEQILEILLNSKMVTPEKYQELKKQAEAEDAELQRLRALEKKVKEEKAPAGNAKVDFKKGFTMESEDGENKLRLSGRLHADYRWFLNDNPANDTFLIRRARLAALGTFYKHYDFSVEYEMGQGSSQLNDAFLNINYWPEAQLMFGQYKVPFSLEELHSDNWIDFIERSLANNFAPSRDIGIMLHGNVSKDLLYYQLGVFNGRKLNSSDVDDQKDVAGRVTIAPFSKMDNKILKGLHIGGAFTSGSEHTTNPSTDWWRYQYKTAGGTTFLQFNDTVAQDGSRNRLGGELAWLMGPVSLKSEYMSLQMNDLTYNKQKASFENTAGYVSLGWFLTGEEEPWRNGLPQQITPKKPFKLGKPGYCGAFQLVGRYEWIDMDPDILKLGFADPKKYTDKASGYTFGLTWYPNDLLRFMVNYYYTKFDDAITVSGKKFDNEQAIMTRFEVVW
jgi:phosphate-selective porin OprO and OprP